ncbi:MAG: ATP-binding protein, partial [Arenimonas sp.]|nr:ATP-binding protein [Arenimonas sp.]
MSGSRKKFSLAARFAALAAALVFVAVLATLALAHFFQDSPLLVASLSLLLLLPFVLWTVRSQFRPMLSLFRALTGTVTSYRDGDFSFGLRWPKRDELSDLVAAHNELGDVLREQRLGLVQRELLLDTMVQNTPVAMLLIAESG